MPVARIASFEDTPVILAEDSDSADVTAELVDVGAGTSERDYAGKNVRGKLVLTSAPPGDVAPLAIDKFGAKGMVSAAQNQVTAWWKEDENLIRWGHLDSFETPSHVRVHGVAQADARVPGAPRRGEHVRCTRWCVRRVTPPPTIPSRRSSRARTVAARRSC